MKMKLSFFFFFRLHYLRAIPSLWTFKFHYLTIRSLNLCHFFFPSPSSLKLYCVLMVIKLVVVVFLFNAEEHVHVLLISFLQTEMIPSEEFYIMASWKKLGNSSIHETTANLWMEWIDWKISPTCKLWHPKFLKSHIKYNDPFLSSVYVFVPFITLVLVRRSPTYRVLARMEASQIAVLNMPKWGW